MEGLKKEERRGRAGKRERTTSAVRGIHIGKYLRLMVTESAHGFGGKESLTRIGCC